MRLIDVDAFKSDYGMADECKDCKTAYPIATGIIGDGRMMTFAVVVNGRMMTTMSDDILNRIRTAINAEIAELNFNMGKHSKEVQTHAIMIVEGLRRALRIVEEIFLKDGE